MIDHTTDRLAHLIGEVDSKADRSKRTVEGFAMDLADAALVHVAERDGYRRQRWGRSSSRIC